MGKIWHYFKWCGIILVLLLIPISSMAAPPMRPPSAPDSKKNMGYGGSNTEIAFNFLIDQGFSEVQAAAICGNLHLESAGMDPQRIEDRDDEPGGYGRRSPEVIVDGDHGYGLAQWTTADRQQGLADFAKKKNMSSGTIELQLLYLIHEMEKGMIDFNVPEFKTITNIKDAVIYVCSHYERPLDYSSMMQRIAIAEEYLFKKGVGISGTATGIGSIFGWLNDTLKIDFEEMLNVGKELGEAIDTIVSACSKAIKLLNAHALWLLMTFAILDLAVYLSFSVGIVGGNDILYTIASRAIKYGFFAFLINNWGDIVNMFFIGLFDNVGAIALNKPDVAQMITNPEVILRANLAHATPSFNYLTQTKIINLILWYPLTSLNIFMIQMIWLMSVFFTFYVIVSYVEFMLSAALAVITIPFGVSKYLKFIPEGLVGNIFSCSLKLLCLGFMLGLTGNALDNISYKANSFFDILDMLLFLVTFAATLFLSASIPSKFAKALGGKVEL